VLDGWVAGGHGAGGGCGTEVHDCAVVGGGGAGGTGIGGTLAGAGVGDDAVGGP